MSFQKGHITSEATRKKMSESHKGMKHTEESKRKMSLSNKGRPKSAEHRSKMIPFPKGHIPWNAGTRKTKIYKGRVESSTSFKKGCTPWNKGKTFSDALKRKLSLAHMGRPHKKSESGMRSFREKMCGKNHFAWIVDRSQLKDDSKDRGGQLHREWSKKVKDRDGWRCRMFNSECSDKIVAHHIAPWREHVQMRYVLSNGITLCSAHHPRTRSDENRLRPFFTGLLSSSPI